MKIPTFSHSQIPNTKSITTLDPVGQILSPNQNAVDSIDKAIADTLDAVNRPWKQVFFVNLSIPLTNAGTLQYDMSGTNIKFQGITGATTPGAFYLGIAPQNPMNGPIFLGGGIASQITGVLFDRFFVIIPPGQTVSGGFANLLIWTDSPLMRVELR